MIPKSLSSTKMIAAIMGAKSKRARKLDCLRLPQCGQLAARVLTLSPQSAHVVSPICEAYVTETTERQLRLLWDRSNI